MFYLTEMNFESRVVPPLYGHCFSGNLPFVVKLFGDILLELLLYTETWNKLCNEICNETTNVLVTCPRIKRLHNILL